MSEKYKELHENLNKTIAESDNLALSMFTFDLIDCIFIDVADVDIEDISEDLLEGYVNEIRNSLEIMNPDLKKDIEILEKLLETIVNYLENN